MKKIILCLLCALLAAGTGCAQAGQETETDEVRLTVVATTYPVYLFASAVTDGVDGVSVVRLNTGETSCVHDYTLSVDDMKKLERADVIVLNGAGLEDFMEDALASSQAQVIDCSQGVELLFTLAHEDEEEDHAGHDHDHGDYDPHIWMDPDNAVRMVDNLAQGLTQADEAYASAYQANAQTAAALLQAWSETLHTLLDGSSLDIPGLITFHDGFQYFAKAFGLPQLAAIEEEAGSEASAKEIVEITQMVNQYHIPIIFTEVNGSDATARAIARETGCQVAQLSMCMDGPDDALSNYWDALAGNLTAIVNGFSEGGATP
jgi:ABC-type Zn uptake system ZnuABC Zn-binding protein ZnuA